MNRKDRRHPKSEETEKKILHTEREELLVDTFAARVAKEQLEVEQKTLQVLQRIEHDLNPNVVNHFKVSQGDSMAILGIIPGSTGVFVAVPLNTAGNPVDVTTITAPPVWKSSDPLAVVTENADGLGASVSVDASASVAGSFVLTVTQADGSAATPVTIPYDAKPVDNVVASFGVSQTS